MIDTGALNVGGRRTAGSGGGGGGGGVSATWVDENYISKAFFNQLFTIHSDTVTQADPYGEVIEPNDVETTVASIQALVGLWTEEYISALGLNSGGGGGGGVTLNEPLASINQMNRTPSNGQTLIYQNNQWTYGSISGGSVTSVGMRVPTGLSVTPATITSSGTFVISLSTGYSIPTTAKQTNWDTAYGWGNHATAGYASASSVQTLQGYFDANGNAKSALKLTTISKKAWGQTYWTSGGVPTDISGTLQDVEDVEIKNGNKIKWKNSGGSLLGMITLSSSNEFVLGESTAANSYNTYLRGHSIIFQSGYTSGSTVNNASLDSTGLFTVKKLKIGSIVIEEDINNGGLHIVSAGLYSDTYISALGANSGGGGGGGVTLKEPLVGINDSNLGAPSQGTMTGTLIVFNGTSWSYSHSRGVFVKSLESSGNIQTIGNILTTAGRAAIGGSINSSYKLCVYGTSCFTDTVGIGGYNNSYKLYVSGNMYCQDLNAHGFRIDWDSTNLEYNIGSLNNEDVYLRGDWYTRNGNIVTSDERLKNIVSHQSCGIDIIAKAPIFNFTWKDNSKSKEYLGTSAQHWEKVFPSAVKHSKSGTLSMDYGATALAAAVMTARRVVELEKEIAELKSKLQQS